MTYVDIASDKDWRIYNDAKPQFPHDLARIKRLVECAPETITVADIVEQCRDPIAGVEGWDAESLASLIRCTSDTHRIRIEVDPLEVSMRDQLIRGDSAILNVAQARPLVSDWINEGELVLLQGPSNSGKTLVATSLLGSVATGRDWQGHSVRAGTALDIAAEGGQAKQPRWSAWKTCERVSGDVDNMMWLIQRPNLRSRREVKALCNVLAIVGPDLVVIDTLNRTFGGGNENSSDDMGAYIAGLDSIREATGAAVVVVHHTGKDERSGSRGHSSLLAAVDVEISVRQSAAGIATVESTKQRDRENPAPLRFVLEPHAGSVALVPADKPDGLAKAPATALDALRRITADGPATTSLWQSETAADGCGRTAFYEARKDLLRRGLVRSVTPDNKGPFVPAHNIDDMV